MDLLRLVVATAAAGAVLGLTSCSSGTGASAEASPTSASVAAPTPAPEPSGAASPSPLATLPAGQCLTGTYALVRFVAVGGETYGTGQGGDLRVAFDDGRYTLTGRGAQPVVVTIAGQTGNLTVDGESKGTYRLTGDTATFSEATATGSGTLTGVGGGAGQKLTMKQVDSVVGLSGDGKVACTAQAMTITLAAVRLELGRA